MPASRMMMMIKNRTSLQNLIRFHLRPAATQLLDRKPRYPLELDFAASEVRPFENRIAEKAPIHFPFGLAAEHFLDRSRSEVRRRPVDNEDLGDVSDDDDADSDDDGSAYDDDSVEEFYKDEFALSSDSE